MLKDFGVKGVKVREIIDLQEDFLATLPYAHRILGFRRRSDFHLGGLSMA